MERECTKQSYPSEREANEVLNSVYKRHIVDRKTGERRNKKIGKKGKRPLRSYKCQYCGQWHLTSQVEGKKQKRKYNGKN